MSRPFDFPKHVRDDAFQRQDSLCAHCGESLVDLWDNAHHVMPNQTGRPNDPRDQWLREVDNCVVLCELCHERVHQDGHYIDGAVALPNAFPYSHGVDASAHSDWATRLLRSF